MTFVRLIFFLVGLEIAVTYNFLILNEETIVVVCFLTFFFGFAQKAQDALLENLEERRIDLKSKLNQQIYKSYRLPEAETITTLDSLKLRSAFAKDAALLLVLRRQKRPKVIKVETRLGAASKLEAKLAFFQKRCRL
jgi:hypothetical protein